MQTGHLHAAYAVYPTTNKHDIKRLKGLIGAMRGKSYLGFTECHKFLCKQSFYCCSMLSLVWLLYSACASTCSRYQNLQRISFSCGKIIHRRRVFKPPALKQTAYSLTEPRGTRRIQENLFVVEMPSALPFNIFIPRHGRTSLQG